ncbi:MAG: HAMP domain-containing histidine kinase [Lachnospiraceae bacterium]|nr:HAMP domain-containing histidine kinase [Lachnospiraceae bacterium]
MKQGLSIRWRILFIFIGVMVAIILAFLVMSRVYWNAILARRNRDTVKKTYEVLIAFEKSGEESTEAFERAIGSIRGAATPNVAVQGDEDWTFTVLTRTFISPQEEEFLLRRLMENLINPSTEGIRILDKGEDYTLQEVRLESGGRYYECYGFLTDRSGARKAFIISMPLMNIEIMAQGNGNLFVISSIVLLILGGLAVFLCTNRITKPIRQLTEISRKMTDLDFSARYEGDYSDEIGELGRNMNALSERLAVSYDELKVTNEQLERELEEKEHVDEMRKDFISNVSHELKTPIALIQGYAEGLRDVKDDQESFDYYLDVITDESERMNRMVRKLTTLNQLEFGSAEMTIAPFSISEMAEDIVQTFQKQILESGAHVSIEGAKDLMVSGDAFEIEEVLTNYLSNAFNHLKDPNNIVLTLEDLHEKCRVSVFNTGEQIPADELDKIWIKFYKVDKARTREYGGSGIGLSIVRAIMEAHHEAYGVYNRPDGVVFWFELPVFFEDKEEAPKEA